MKLTCTRENLAHALDVVSGIAGKQANNLPILSNVYIEAKESTVDFIATDLELAAKVTIRSKVESPGSFTVPVKMLSDFVRLLKAEQIELSVETNELNIKCGSSSTSIKGAPTDEYPVLPDNEETHNYTMLVEPFRQSLAKVVIAAAKNEIRPALAGVYCNFYGDRYEGLILAATDSYRLSEKKVSIAQGNEQTSCIVPTKMIQEMIRLLALGGVDESQVRLWVGDNQLGIRYNDFELTCNRLIDDNYPDYAQIIPNDFSTTAKLNLDELSQQIKAASLFTTTGVNAVSFDVNVSENTLGISSTSTQKGAYSSEMDIDASGDENSILLNCRYVLDGLQHMEGPDVAFQLSSPDAPCLFRPENGDDFLYIVMPIRQ